MSKVKKAIIPVAGLGTRCLPATKAIPKEMMPIVDKPMIQFVVEEAAAAGITDIVFITHPSKFSVVNHFDTNFELETQLRTRGKDDLLKVLQESCPPGMSFIAIRQAEARGLGHAILTAKPAVENEDFAVLLPDVLLDPFSSNLRQENLAAMIERFHENLESQILVEAVEQSEVDKYGIVDVGEGEIEAGQYRQIKRVVEKPKTSEAPSNLAVVGRYVLSRNIWTLLERLEPGAGGEIQLTDAIDDLIQKEVVNAFLMTGNSHDCGSNLGYLKANVHFGLKDPRYSSEFTDYLSGLKI